MTFHVFNYFIYLSENFLERHIPSCYLFCYYLLGMKKTRVVVIVPTYNEKENIGRLITSLTKIGRKIKNHHLLTLIVDDNSPDGTGKIVTKLMAKDKSIFLSTGPKKGLGRAMIRGITYARDKLKADIVVSTEADFAYDNELILFATNKIDEGFDLVVASRHVPGGASQGWTLSRKIHHYLANTVFATWLTGERKVKDHNGAFRAVKVKGVLDKLNLSSINVRGFAFFNYSLFRLTQLTDKIYEFPTTYHFRTRGESKISFNPKYFSTYFRDVWEYIYLCFRIRLEKMGAR